MSQSARIETLDPEAYIQGELRSDTRHEYVAGQLFAMVGASRRHNAITLNIATLLRDQLSGTPCQVYMADVKVRIEAADAFYYPDVVVGCAADDDNDYYLTKPRLIVEVTSPSTETTDRREKFFAYRRIPELTDYLLVSQEGRAVEHLIRDDGEWTFSLYKGGETIGIDSLDATINIDDLYRGT